MCTNGYCGVAMYIYKSQIGSGKWYLFCVVNAKEVACSRLPLCLWFGGADAATVRPHALAVYMICKQTIYSSASLMHSQVCLFLFCLFLLISSLTLGSHSRSQLSSPLITRFSLSPRRLPCDLSDLSIENPYCGVAVYIYKSQMNP